MSYAAFADGLWLFGTEISQGKMRIAAKPAYMWSFRFFAIAVMVIGVWDVWRSWLPAIYP
jgi:hypothetical protein